MTLLGETSFAVRPEFKDFEKNVVKGVSDAVTRASKSAKPVEIGADTKKLETGLLKIGNLARAAAGIALVAGFKKAIDVGEQYAGTVRRISSVTGESAEESSKLVFALQRVGLNEVRAAAAVVVLNKNLASGSKAVKQYFTDVQIADLRTKSFAGQLPILSAEFQKLQKGAERTNFLRDLFGRGGQDLGKLLSLTTTQLRALSEEAERFGLVLSEKNVADFKRFTESNRQLQQSMKGLQTQVGLLTIPVLEKLNAVTAQAITVFTNAHPAVQTVAGVFAVAAVGIGKYGQAIQAAASITRSVVSATATAAAAVGDFAAQLLRGKAAAQAASSAISVAAAESALLARGFVITGSAASTQTAAVAASAKGLAGLGGVVAGVAAAAALAAIGVALFLRNLNKEAQNTADTIANDAGPDIIKKIDDIRKARERAQAQLDQAESSDARRAAKAGLGGGDALGAFAASQTDEVGRLGREVEKLNEKERELIALERALGNDALPQTTAQLASQRTEFQGLVSSLSFSARFAEASAVAQTKLERALVGVAINSEAGVQAQARYAQSLFDVQKAAADLAGIEIDEAKVREGALASARATAEAFEAAQEQRVKAAESARDRLADALQAGEESIDRSEKALARAIIDGNRQIEDARRSLSEVIVSGNERIKESQEDVADTIKSSNEAIKASEKEVAEVAKESKEKRLDAQRQVREATIEGAERIKESEERLAEVRLSALERVKDAEESLIDAQEDVAKSIEDSLRRVSDAVRGVADAEQSLADARLSAADRVLSAEKRLAQVDGTREKQLEGLTEAQRKEFERQEDIAEARAALDKAKVDAAKEIADAEKRVVDARTARAEAELAAVKTQEDAAKRIQEAQNQVVEAQRQATKDIAEAQKARASAISESNAKVAESQKNLREVIKDTNEEINESHKRHKEVVRDANEAVRDSQKRLQDTIKSSNDAIADSQRRLQEVERSASEARVAAQEAVQAAHKASERAISEAKTAVDETEGALNAASEKAGNLAENLKVAADQAARLRRETNAATVDFFVRGPGFPGLMAGGPAAAGDPYVVGERGPELFIPNQNGQVVSNDVLIKLLRALERGGGGGRPIVVNVYQVANDPEATAFAVASRLGSASRR